MSATGPQNRSGVCSPVDPKPDLPAPGVAVAVDAELVGGVGVQLGEAVDAGGDAAVQLHPCLAEVRLEGDEAGLRGERGARAARELVPVVGANPGSDEARLPDAPDARRHRPGCCEADAEPASK